MPKFEKGNEFWRQVSRYGRPMLFSSPDLMWDAACEYFAAMDDNPLIKYEPKILDGKIVSVKVPIMRAYTWEGLTRHLDCNKEYFFQFKKDRSGKCTPEFSRVIAQIESVIFQQKFEGAAGGLLNANIIARDLGLTDKKDITQNVITVMQDEDEETDEEA